MLQLAPLLLLLGSCIADDYVHNPIQYHSQTPKGSYNYGYDTGLFGSHSFHQENKDKNGQVRGRYGYTDPDGNLRLTYYTAGPQGFNVIKDTPAPNPAPVVHDTHSGVTHLDDGPAVHVSSHSRPVPAPCKYRDPPCTQKSKFRSSNNSMLKLLFQLSNTSIRINMSMRKSALGIQLPAKQRPITRRRKQLS